MIFSLLVKALCLPVHFHVAEEGPLHLLAQALLLPRVQTLGKVRCAIPYGGVVRDDHENIIQAVQLLQLAHGVSGERDVQAVSHVVERVRGLAAA